MKSIILVSVEAMETRVALLEDGRLAELYVERGDARRYVGNIYKGRVQNVLPGMQAAFVDIGLSQNGFLHVSDITHLYRDVEIILGEAVLQNGEDEEKEEVPSDDEAAPSVRPPFVERSISDLLVQGQEILIQVTKDPTRSKGVRLSTNISLPGRLLVYMPEFGHIGVSHRITDEAERLRLREAALSLCEGREGFIIRTEAEGKGVEELARDARMLRELWKTIQEKGERSSACVLVYQDLGLVTRIIRDLFTENISELMVDDYSRFEEILGAAGEMSLRSRVSLYEGDVPLFEQYNVEEQIKEALRQKVPLKSGGSLVFDQTEALVTIDVNTGSYIGQSDLAETVFHTNMEAVDEIARQIRLRNLGGIILVDFIDMRDPAHQQEVIRKLEEKIKRDRIKTNLVDLTHLGLVELTRKRGRGDLYSIMCSPCPFCEGRGTVHNLESISSHVWRVIQSQYAGRSQQVLLKANPIVIEGLATAAFPQRVKEEFDIHLTLTAESKLPIDNYEVTDPLKTV